MAWSKCLDRVCGMSNWNALDEYSDDTSNANSSMNTADVTEVLLQMKTKAANSNEKSSSQSRDPSNRTFCYASEKEYNDYQSVAEHLSILLHRTSFASEYWVRVQVFEPSAENLSAPADQITSSSHNGIVTRK